MSKLIITAMPIRGKNCLVSAVSEENQISELRIEPLGANKILNHIYLGKVETVSPNINAAFVLFQNGQRGYFPLEEQGHVIYSAGTPLSSGQRILRPGDEILVQISREAMKGKLPALSSNLTFTGKYLVLTTGNKKFGLSSKLSGEDRTRLSKWLLEESSQPDKEYGLVVRTNAADASKEELFRELAALKEQYKQAVIYGRQRTCYSLLYQPDSFYIEMLRGLYHDSLEEIITDLPDVKDQIHAYLLSNDQSQTEKLRFYQDPLLPLYKLYRIEKALNEVSSEKIWLSSGGFLVIQQTEAFVSIDVNSGKYTSRKKAEEAYRKINLEAAEEIARQLRLRNLSGIILIDFINMSNPDHQDELFHVLKKYVRKDSVKCSVIDITPLHILEMTRKKIRRPLIEDLQEL